jgi:hypothetical protein
MQPIAAWGQAGKHWPPQHSAEQHTPPQQFWSRWQQANLPAQRQGVMLSQTSACVPVSHGVPWHERQSSQAWVHALKAAWSRGLNNGAQSWPQPFLLPLPGAAQLFGTPKEKSTPVRLPPSNCRLLRRVSPWAKALAHSSNGLSTALCFSGGVFMAF